MYWFSQEVCSCHTEESIEAKANEVERLLYRTCKKLDEVTEEYHISGASEKREEELYNLIKRYQKYVTYVKSALPRKSKYLTNIEKLMKFELAKVVRDTRPQYFNGKLIYLNYFLSEKNLRKCL